MKYALISPNEPREAGYRVADVHPDGFDVAEPLFWSECADEVVADKFWYDPSDGQLKEVPEPVIEEPQLDLQPTVSGAETL